MSNLSIRKKQAKSLLNLKEKKIKSKNMFLRIFFIFFIGGYAFFLTSKQWFPADGKVIPATRLNHELNYEDRIVTVNRWEYSPEQHIMEVELTIDNQSLDGIDKYKYEVLERKNGKLMVEPMVEKQNFVMLRISNIPDNWLELSLRLKIPKAKNNLRLYTNKNDVKRVNELKNLSVNGYMIKHINTVIDNYQNKIKVNEKEISKLEKKIINAKNNISNITEQMQYQTDQEREVSNTKISNQKTEIENINTEIQKLDSDIKEFMERIEKLKEQKKVYK